MRTVLIVLFDGVQSLDVTGPLEVFAHANAYQITMASLAAKPARTSSGLTLIPDADLRAQETPGLLIVPGGPGARRRDPDLVSWLRGNASKAPRLASVCPGSRRRAAASRTPRKASGRPPAPAATAPRRRCAAPSPASWA